MSIRSIIYGIKRGGATNVEIINNLLFELKITMDTRDVEDIMTVKKLDWV